MDQLYIPSAAILEAVKKHNSTQVHEVIYPAFFETADECGRLPDDLMQKYENQSEQDVLSELQKICTSRERARYYTSNPSISASFFNDPTNQTDELKQAYCTLKREEAVEDWEMQVIDQSYEATSVIATSIAAGIFTQLTTVGRANYAVDFAIAGSVIAYHYHRIMIHLEQIENLKGMTENSIINTNCSIDRYQAEQQRLEKMLFWDFMGVLAGIAINKYFPGVSAIISKLFLSGRAGLMRVGVRLFAVLPSQKVFFQIPRVDLIRRILDSKG